MSALLRHVPTLLAPLQLAIADAPPVARAWSQGWLDCLVGIAPRFVEAGTDRPRLRRVTAYHDGWRAFGEGASRRPALWGEGPANDNEECT